MAAKAAREMRNSFRDLTIALAICTVANPAAGTTPSTTVITTGEEQKAVEQHATDWERPDAGDFANVPDLVHTVLVQRGDPTPDPEELRRKAVRAMSQVLSEQSAKETPEAADKRQSTWLDHVRESRSFTGVIRDASWPDDKARQEGIDAGIRAMLPTGSWLLPQEQAEPIRRMMKAREQDPDKQSGAPASFELKRLEAGVIYLRIPTFEDATLGRRIVDALQKELAAGADGVLIDLRDNPGGQPEPAKPSPMCSLIIRRCKSCVFRTGGS